MSSSIWMSALAPTRSVASDLTTDQDLIAAYRGGDERAAAELVARHGAAVRRFLYSSGAGTDELDDLVQETLFRAFRRLDSWRGESSFRSWLLTIGGNLLKDQARSRKGRNHVALEGQELADGADPHHDFARGEIEERLRRELAQLPRLQRDVFLLRAQHGREYSDIASALGTTAGAARVHYHHAVKRLKELFR
jgi:RNA polymerase sigma-70 factor (ECF subfamily)